MSSKFPSPFLPELPVQQSPSPEMPTTSLFLPAPAAGFDWTERSLRLGVTLECAPLSAVAPHLFTTGHLWLRGDEGEWAALAAAFSVPPSSVRLVKQVHRADVAVGAAATTRPGRCRRPTWW